jgi:hypothetical protein
MQLWMPAVVTGKICTDKEYVEHPSLRIMCVCAEYIHKLSLKWTSVCK